MPLTINHPSLPCISNTAQTLGFINPITEATFGRLHNSGVGAFGAHPTVVESIMGDHICIKYDVFVYPALD